MPTRGDRHRAIDRLCSGVLAGVLVLGAAGCGGDRDKAGPGPSPVAVTTTGPASRVSDTPAPSPTPSDIYAAPASAYVKPDRPAVLDGKPSEKAAIEFAKYYLRMYTYAYLTGDADELNKLARSDCQFCGNVKRDIADEYARKHHDEGGVMAVIDARAHDFTVDGAFDVTMSVRQAPHRTLDAYGNVLIDEPTAKPYSALFILYWTKKQGWQVAELGVKPA
jgi:hypothetical protein